uniref:Keratin 82 n=1 Tax=Oryctolagus cuniculus TaxID=9986 RepID=A0A5F9CYJ9_RABIT
MSCRSIQLGSRCSSRGFSSCSAIVPRLVTHYAVSSGSCRYGGAGGLRTLCYPSSRSLCNVGFGKPRVASRCGLPAFGYRAGGPCGSPASIAPVTINENLLVPLALKIDPTVQKVKRDEKEQIKGLNNRFASFINKVRFLEQKNKLLETKWNFMQQQRCCQSNIQPLFDAYINNLRRQLDAVSGERGRLEAELCSFQDTLEAYKKKYEEEVSLRASIENEFVTLKKEVDTVFLVKADLETNMEALVQEINFLKNLYEEVPFLLPLAPLTSVIVKMDNSRDLDVNDIISEIKSQYDDIVSRSKAEAEAWYQSRYEEMPLTAGTHFNTLRASRMRSGVEKDIHSCSRDGEHQSQLGAPGALVTTFSVSFPQRAKLEEAVAQAEQQGEGALNDARSKLAGLEAALQKAKQDMACLLKEYQEVMNSKLGLDIEIATYRRLLEGEENSSSKGALLYEPCVESTPLLRTDYCSGGTSILKSGGSCSVVGTGKLYIPCEPQGLRGCGSSQGSSRKC